MISFISFIPNTIPGYYQIHSYVGSDQDATSEILNKFSKLGFTGYEILHRNYDGNHYMIHFTDLAMESQFKFYFNDVIDDIKVSLKHISTYTIIDYK